MSVYQKGFAGMGVILMLVVLGGIALTGGLLYQQKAGTSFLDIMGTQAYQAARSGADWGLYQSLQANSCVLNTSINLPDTLSAYTVSVQCNRTSITEGNSVKTVDTIISTACNAAVCTSAGAEPTYVERQIQTMVVK